MKLQFLYILTNEEESKRRKEYLHEMPFRSNHSTISLESTLCKKSEVSIFTSN